MSQDRVSRAEKAIGALLDGRHVRDGSMIGLVTREGPVYTTAPVPDSLNRYLINALPLPPPNVTIASPTPDRSSLGLGFGLGMRKKPRPPIEDVSGERQSSWTSWVPGMPGTAKETTKESSGSRWPSFGLSSMGMATMFGGSSTPGSEPISAGTAEASTKTAEETASIASSHLVEQSEVVLTDLEAAVDTNEIELVWDKKDIWLLGHDGEYEKRRLTWIIVRLQLALPHKMMLIFQRDDKLLFIIFPPDTSPPFEVPPTSETLAVFASLPDITVRSSVDSSRSATPVPTNSYVHKSDQRTDIQTGMDMSSSISLLELRDQLVL